MAFFDRETLLCEIFIKKMKRKNVKLTYEVNTFCVSIFVCYKSNGDWNVLASKKYLNKLWKDFNLAFIGYRHRCLVLNYRRKKFKDSVTEYLFPMKHFSIDNFYSSDF